MPDWRVPLVDVRVDELEEGQSVMLQKRDRDERGERGDRGDRGDRPRRDRGDRGERGGDRERPRFADRAEGDSEGGV